MRNRSKALFGNRDRLEVAVVIAHALDGMVNATDLSREIELPNNRARAQLLSLREAGLLDVMPTTLGKKWYRRRQHPF
ncbi:MAG TPA: hypothetical protein VFP17_05280, partial [Solirubrobacterales bacterium]|nr:hypothetical protein [Solirubrobacterales bacterium]